MSAPEIDSAPSPLGETDWLESLAKLRELAEEHAKVCKLPECERCDRYLCADGCGTRVPSRFRRCDACAKDRGLARWRAMVPPEHVDVKFSSPLLGKLIAPEVLELLDVPPGELRPRVTLLGDAGAGKTSLAVAILRRNLVKHGGELFVKAPALAVARSLHPLGQGEAPLVAQALSTRFLVLDELGLESSQPAHASLIGEVIDTRHAARLPTVVTSGLTDKEIGARYGGGIARRLFEDALVLRLKKRAEVKP